MTRKEAIQELQSYAYNSWGGLSEAFKTAIEALKQPEIIYCKDCNYKNDEYECPFYNMGYLCGDYSYCSYAERKDD